jgi:hypothetical protein
MKAERKEGGKKRKDSALSLFAFTFIHHPSAFILAFPDP